MQKLWYGAGEQKKVRGKPKKTVVTIFGIFGSFSNWGV